MLMCESLVVAHTALNVISVTLTLYLRLIISGCEVTMFKQRRKISANLRGILEPLTVDLEKLRKLI